MRAIPWSSGSSSRASGSRTRRGAGPAGDLASAARDRRRRRLLAGHAVAILREELIDDLPELEKSRRALEKCLKAAGEIDYRHVMQFAYDSLGSIALREGRIADARSSFLKSLRITFEDGQLRDQLGSLRDLATVLWHQGKVGRALELLAVVLHHPARHQNSPGHHESLKAEAERLLAEIETLLPAGRRASAWEHGRTLELGKVVDTLLAEDRDGVAGQQTFSSPIPVGGRETRTEEETIDA